MKRGEVPASSYGVRGFGKKNMASVLGLGRAAPHVHVEAESREVREEVRGAGDEVLAGLEEDCTVVGVEAGP